MALTVNVERHVRSAIAANVLIRGQPGERAVRFLELWRARRDRSHMRPDRRLVAARNATGDGSVLTRRSSVGAGSHRSVPFLLR
jgi:hypothetical protein